MSSSQVFTRLQRILIYGIFVYAMAPLALGMLFLASGYGVAIIPALTAYYVFAIVGFALLAFERLSKELRTSSQANP